MHHSSKFIPKATIINLLDDIDIISNENTYYIHTIPVSNRDKPNHRRDYVACDCCRKELILNETTFTCSNTGCNYFYCSARCYDDDIVIGHELICQAKCYPMTRSCFKHISKQKYRQPIELAIKVIAKLIAYDHLKQKICIKDSILAFINSYNQIDNQKSALSEDEREEVWLLFMSFLMSEKDKFINVVEIRKEINLEVWNRILDAIYCNTMELCYDATIVDVVRSLPSMPHSKRPIGIISHFYDIMTNNQLSDDQNLHFNMPMNSITSFIERERKLCRLAQICDKSCNIIQGEINYKPYDDCVICILVLVPPKLQLKHSCIPNCILEFNCDCKLQLVSLYDIYPEELWTIDKNTLFSTLISCECPLCIYRASLNTIPTKRSICINLYEMKNIANYFMNSKEIEKGIECYQSIIEQLSVLDESSINSNSELFSDVFYTLGAIYVDKGTKYWRQGHSIWRNGYQTLESKCNKTLELEVKKINQYGSHEVSLNDLYAHRFVPYTKLSNLINVFETKDVVIPIADCNRFIKLADKYSMSHGWTTSRHYSVPTLDIPIHLIDEIFPVFNDYIKESIIHVLVDQFKGTNTQENVICHVAVHDAFIVKYSQPFIDDEIKNIINPPSELYKDTETFSKGNLIQKYLPLHSDQSTHSFVITLNDPNEFVGGGTYFADLRKSITPAQGKMVSFDGKLVHGGDPLVYGTRYIIAAFMLLEYENKNDSKISLSSCFSQKTGKEYSFGFTL